jgi:hypothetical protein
MELKRWVDALSHLVDELFDRLIPDINAARFAVWPDADEDVTALSIGEGYGGLDDLPALVQRSLELYSLPLTIWRYTRKLWNGGMKKAAYPTG